MKIFSCEIDVLVNMNERHRGRGAEQSHISSLSNFMRIKSI